MSNVYWITGLSGAGKTTIGRLWYDELVKSGEPSVILDGDELRRAINDDLGYSQEDRRKGAMRNARLCALLSKQNITVVCCTISMFDEVREWNRANIPNYFEVYIKVTMDTLRQRDQKGLYSSGNNEIAGIGVCTELPKNPDLILDNDGDKSPLEQIEIFRESVLNHKSQKG